MPNLCLVVDLSNQAARAYFAAKQGKEGQSVIGLARYGLKKMTQTLLRECDPLRILVACDCAGPTFRHLLHDDYKKGRAEKDEEYRQFQIEAPGILAAEFGAEVYESQGYEADDVIATLCDKMLPYQMRSVIASNDGDLFQLVIETGDGAGTFQLKYDQGTYRVIDEVAVKEKFKVPPHRVALAKSLMGDPGDGYAGIPGIGGVAAARLANQFPSVKAMYAGLDKIASKPDRTKLEAAGQELAEKMFTLAQLRTDVPLVRVA